MDDPTDWRDLPDDDPGDWVDEPLHVQAGSVSPDAERAVAEAAPDASTVSSIGESVGALGTGVGQGVTAGFSDEAVAGLGALTGAGYQGPRAAARGFRAPADERTAYERYLAEERSRLSDMDANNEISMLAGNVLGTVVSSAAIPLGAAGAGARLAGIAPRAARALTAVGTAGKGLPLAQRATIAANEGAAIGALEGLGRSEAQSAEGLAVDAGLSGVFGAIGGAGTTAAVPAALRGVRWAAANPTVRRVASGITDVLPMPQSWRSGVRDAALKTIEVAPEETTDLRSIRRMFGDAETAPNVPGQWSESPVPAAGMPGLQRDILDRGIQKAHHADDLSALRSGQDQLAGQRSSLAGERSALQDSFDAIAREESERAARRAAVEAEVAGVKRTLPRELATSLTDQEDALKVIMEQAHTGLKLRSVENLLAEEIEAGAKIDIDAVQAAVLPSIDQIRDILKASVDNPANFPGQSAYGSKKVLKQIDSLMATFEEGVNESGASGWAKVFNAAERIKRATQQITAGTKDRTFHRELDDVTEPLRAALENPALWGQRLGDQQRTLNQAWRSLLGRQSEFRSAFLRDRGDLPQWVAGKRPDPYGDRLIGDETKLARLLESGLGDVDTRHIFDRGIAERSELQNQLRQFYDPTDALSDVGAQAQRATSRLQRAPAEIAALRTREAELAQLGLPGPRTAQLQEAERQIARRGRDLDAAGRELEERGRSLGDVGRQLDAPIEQLEYLRGRGDLGRRLAEGLERGDRVQALREQIPLDQRALDQRFDSTVRQVEGLVRPLGKLVARGGARLGVSSDRTQEIMASRAAAYGQYGAALADAMQRGPEAFGAAHYVLSQREPEFRELDRRAQEEFDDMQGENP